MAVPDPQRDTSRAEAPARGVPEAYEHYFASGHYDRRYPRPNPTVLRLIRRELPPGGNVIDFGCGSGRYLLALRGQAGVAAGYDICSAALDAFRRVAGTDRRGRSPHVLGPDPDDLDRHVQAHGAADLVLCLFGVLSHIEGAEKRRRALRRMAGLLRPGSGRLILSVPNRRRRFRHEQREQAALLSGEIRYLRRFRGLSLALPYKLDDLDDLGTELAGAGLVIVEARAESLVPEALVANSPILRTLDRWLAPLAPASFGYGILVLVRPATVEDGA
jgi:tRNA (uracil-5-)-methyltransferase TRM9